MTRLRRPQLLLVSVFVGSLAILAVACSSHLRTAKGESSACPDEFGSFSTDAHHWPGACWRPYGPSSPFNTPIPPNPRLARNSDSIIRYMASQHWSFGARRKRFTLEAQGSRPVYWSQGTDPLVRVHCRGGYSCQPGMQVRIPRSAKPEAEYDGHMTIVDQAHGREYDFWQATTPVNGSMWVSSGNGIPIGSDSGTGLGSDASASYLGALGGLIRAPELQAGTVDHALALVVPCVQSRDVWPSPPHGRGDAVCPHGGAGPHFANLLQLNMSDAEIAGSRAPAWQRALMWAMAHYGLYVVDTDGSAGRAARSLSLVKEDDRSFTSVGQAGQMRRVVRTAGGNTVAIGSAIDMSRFRVIDPCVPRRRC